MRKYVRTVKENSIYAVIDTNVIVSAFLAKSTASSPAKVFFALYEGTIGLLYNDEILEEYINVLSRKKFNFAQEDIMNFISFVKEFGLDSERISSNEYFPDPKDVVFYEVALSRESSFLVTGNIRHFPTSPIVISPAEMVALIERLER